MGKGMLKHLGSTNAIILGLIMIAAILERDGIRRGHILH